MLIIGNIVAGSEIFDEYFCCDLGACKGACCVEGDGGAPLEAEEVPILEEAYPQYKKQLRPEGRRVIRKQGFAQKGPDGTWETPLVRGRECAYLQYDEDGTAKCGIEAAWNEGKLDFRKPLSCQLYPIRVERRGQFLHLHYHRWSICSPACTNGHQLKIPLYVFLQEALTRAFGVEFYRILDSHARQRRTTDRASPRHRGDPA